MQAPVAEKGSFIKKALVVLGVCTAFTVVSTGGFLLQLIANKSLDPSMLYPFVTGGSTVFSTIIAFIVFKEKINLNVLISLALMLVGTILFMF
jgi:multidrug transporter EmrE-like cation transporter